jgi:hypothetical protein
LLAHGLSTPLADEWISGSPDSAGAPKAGSSAGRTRAWSRPMRSDHEVRSDQGSSEPARLWGAVVTICAGKHQLSSPVSLTTLAGSQETAAVLFAASVVDPFRVTPLPAKVMAAVPMLWTTTWVPAFSA